MASVLDPVNSELAELYQGWDREEIGLGLIQPSIYASDDYQKTKINHLVIGGLSSVIYAGFDHDPTPLILTVEHIPAYNVIVGLNLHYVPEQIRRAIVKTHIENNVNNIENGLPMKIDWHRMANAIPQVKAITRWYKQVGINVIETYGITDWPNVIQEPSRWSNHYRYYV